MESIASEKPHPQKKKSALVQLMCFLSSSGGFQSGEVLSLCGSEVRALRLRRQTGEFQIKNVPSTHFFFDLRPLSRACGSPSALHQPLFTSCQAVIYIALPCAPRRALSLTHLHAPTNPHKSSGRSFACALGFIRVFCSFVPAEELSLRLKLELTRIEKISVDARDNSQAGPSTHGPTELAHDRKTNCTTCTAQVWVICCVSAFTGVDWCVFCQRRLLFPCVNVQSSTMRLSSPLKVKAYALIFRFVSKQGSG